MPILRYSGTDAVKARNTNSHAGWPRPSNTARLGDVVYPHYKPSFNLETGEKILTMVLLR